MHLSELKAKSPSELLAFAEDVGVENASSLRKQDMMFAILKTLADNETAIYGDGTLEILSDGFGFLRSPQANYLPGPDDIYVSPAQVRRFGLRTGDTVEGQIRAPKDGERYFALLKVDNVNFEPPGCFGAGWGVDLVHRPEMTCRAVGSRGARASTWRKDGRPLIAAGPGPWRSDTPR
ncbi:Rho termination factor N-terminal domain-containing protein [Leptolyngbya sp. 15MV]|nr:Rho termination factor N-terminal domain-containing protein [Leptolyngbya sp. 15MV]